MNQKILIANDGSEGAARALNYAITLAQPLLAELHMIYVEESQRIPATIDEIVEETRDDSRRFEEITRRAKSQAEAAGVRIETHVVAGHPVPAIIDFIKREGIELLVIGYMGHSAVYHRLIGSTTDRLVELAPCHVLVVK